MQFAARIIVSIFMLTSAYASAYQHGDWAVADKSAKLRRDGVLHMYPFPRVGRAHHTWQVPVNEYYSEDIEPVDKRQMYAFPRVGRDPRDPRDPFQGVPRHGDIASLWSGLKHPRSFGDYEPIDKRQLYAFPRVGRGSLRDGLSSDDIQSVPIRRTDSPGMWFGPRLGRSVKGDDDDIMIQNEPNEKSEPEQTEVDHLDREKRQTRPL